MIRVYRAPWSTNCERVALALAHKGLEAELVTIDYSDRSEVERVSGQGLVPVIDDDGEVVVDSPVIIRHLDRRYGEPLLFPAEDPARAHCELFCEWFNEVWKAAPNAIEAELERDEPNEPDEKRIAELAATMERHLDLFERLLAGRDHLLGEFSAGDVVAYPFLKYAAGRDPADVERFHVILAERQSAESRPNLAAWIERMRERPRAF